MQYKIEEQGARYLKYSEGDRVVLIEAEPGACWFYYLQNLSWAHPFAGEKISEAHATEIQTRVLGWLRERGVSFDTDLNPS